MAHLEEGYRNKPHHSHNFGADSFYFLLARGFIEDEPLRFEYPQNVSFECTKCGLCCGDTPKTTRHVLLLQQDAERISRYTNNEISMFATKTQDKSPYVYEMYKNQNGKCVFLQNNKCRAYEVRPLICRFYPFELSTDGNGFYKFKVTDECPKVSCNKAGNAGKKLGAGHFKKLLNLACIALNGEST